MFPIVQLAHGVGLVFVVATWGYDQRSSYVGDVVIRVTVPTNQHWKMLGDLLNRILPVEDLDVWRVPDDRERSADVYVKSNYVGMVKIALADASLEYVIWRKHIDRLVRRQRGRSRRHANVNIETPGSDIIGKYARYNRIESWSRQMVQSHAAMARLHYIGDTHEGRAMHVLQIGRHIPGQKAIWVDAGLHAREWIAPASAIYLAHKLLTQYDSDPTVHRLVDHFDWYILIVANPDGYEYTFTKYRFWRKNRRPVKDNCTGVDLNRNWAFKWGGADASPRPCSFIYRGPEPESEREIKNIVNFLLPRKESVLLYLSLHSYGQKFLGRWAYTNQSTPSGHAEMMAVASRVVRSMTIAHRRRYEAGTAATVMYPYSGGSADWARGIARINHSYVAELRDEGVYGFLLPEEEIIPTSQELWAGIKELALHLIMEFLPALSTLPTVVTKAKTTPDTARFTGKIIRNYWRGVQLTDSTERTTVSHVTNCSSTTSQEAYLDLHSYISSSSASIIASSTISTNICLSTCYICLVIYLTRSILFISKRHTTLELT